METAEVQVVGLPIFQGAMVLMALITQILAETVEMQEILQAQLELEIQISMVTQELFLEVEVEVVSVVAEATVQVEMVEMVK